MLLQYPAYTTYALGGTNIQNSSVDYEEVVIDSYDFATPEVSTYSLTDELHSLVTEESISTTSIQSRASTINKYNWTFYSGIQINAKLTSAKSHQTGVVQIIVADR